MNTKTNTKTTTVKPATNPKVVSVNTGKARVEGKDYTVQDGDVMHFRFNV